VNNIRTGVKPKVACAAVPMEVVTRPNVKLILKGEVL